LKQHRYADFNARDFIVCGSARTVTERLIHIVKTLRVGHLMLLPQFGSLSHAKTLENIERISKSVLPHLRPIWENEGWEDHWWPQGAEVSQRTAEAA
jgi:hypothetical protein